MAVELKFPDIEMPDVNKIEIPKPDVSRLEIPVRMERARMGLSNARDSVRDTVRDRLADNLPRREAPSPWPFVLGGILAGITIGYFLATSSWFGPRVKDAVDQAKGRIDQMRGGNGADDELGPVVNTYEMTAVMADQPADAQDPLAPTAQNEQSYAV